MKHIGSLQPAFPFPSGIAKLRLLSMDIPVGTAACLTGTAAVPDYIPVLYSPIQPSSLTVTTGRPAEPLSLRKRRAWTAPLSQILYVSDLPAPCFFILPFMVLFHFTKLYRAFEALIPDTL